ncbi:hypothetical protein [Amycolatopsis sp. cmx-4-68]|uniref:hypothetical protein n=1 Tax=Amycolatopsis sp. cmx-4-68 TaxID=2790938 RepID=UPI0039789084
MEPLELTPEVQAVIEAYRESIVAGSDASVEALYTGKELPELQSSVRDQVNLLVRLARAGQLVGVDLDKLTDTKEPEGDVVKRCERAVTRWKASREMHKVLRDRTAQAKERERERQQVRDNAVVELAAARPDWGTQRMGNAVGLPERTLRDILTKSGNPQ